MIGQRLGPYALEAELGSGGMGTVYRATGPGGPVALKIVHPHLLATPGFFKRFLREAEIGKSVRHENVVRTLDVDALAVDGEQHHFLVMEYVEGQTLRELLLELGCVPEGLCRHIGREIAAGLAAIHATGVIHRDLKPENVLITADHKVKIMDLGVAQLRDEVLRLSQTGAFVGSVHYTAPERFRDLVADGRADFYALGLVLYELATGEFPFRGANFAELMRAHLTSAARAVSEANPRISPFFEEVVAALLEKDREQRLTDPHRVLAEGEESEWWRDRERTIRATTHRPLRRTHTPPETALHGRSEELALLRRLYENARDGGGSVVMVEGEAGVGKSRLVHEFVASLQAEGEDLNFLYGSYPSGGAATAAGGFSTAYREHFGEAGCAEYLRDMPSLVPAFDAVLRGQAPSEGEGTFNAASLHSAFVHATRSLAQERPTVLLIEDLQLAPEEGRAVFAALAKAVARHRILLLGERRPALPDEWLMGLSRLANFTHLKLGRLDRAACQRLLVEALRSERLAADLGPRITTKSDGNPFFALEIVRGLREGDQISRAPDGSWRPRRTITKIEIPSSVLDIVRVRLAFLDAEDRRLLNAASCCGFEFDPPLVAQALGVPQIPAIQRLARIEAKHRLVRSVGRRFAFDHHQVQEVLYSALDEESRVELHAALGAALEDREEQAHRAMAALEGTVAVDLCEHFLRGGRPECARKYLLGGLDHLSRGYLNEAALALADRALEVPGLLEGPGRLEILMRKVRWVSLLGRREEERRILDEALALAKETGDAAIRGTVEWRRGRLELHVSNFEAARRRFEEACESAGASGNRQLEVRALSGLGILSAREGRLDEARQRHEEAGLVARDIGFQAGEAMAAGNLGHVHWSLGNYAEALKFFKRDLTLCREGDDRGSEAESALNMGVICRALGRIEEARAHYESALALLRQVGDRRSEAIGRSNLGNVLLDFGWVADARREFEASLDLAREIEYRMGEVTALVGLGNLEFEAGRKTKARRILKRGLRLARKLDAANAIVEATAALALLPGGDAQEALDSYARLEEALQLREKINLRFMLWKATADVVQLSESHRLLCELCDLAPMEFRTSMIENVPLHRDIMEAWNQSRA